MTEPLSVLIVGAGIIGRNHAEAILRLPRLRIVALADPVAAAGAALSARLPGAPPSYELLAEALDRHRPDLVVICTPSGQHAAQAQLALAAGAHVVIEKPIDVTMDAARPLLEAPAGRIVSVISQHRFDPPAVAVAEAITQGRLGRLTSAVASVPWWRPQEYYDSATWRGTRALDGGGALMNQGVHTVDLLVWLFGQPQEIFAYTALLAHDDIEVEDVAAVVLRFTSGALATLHATTAAFPGTGVRLQVYGTGGTAILNDDRLEYFSAGDLPAAQEKSPDDFVLGHLRQYEDIVDAIDQGRPPRVGVEDGLTALAVVEAVYRSAELGRPVRFDEIWGETR